MMGRNRRNAPSFLNGALKATLVAGAVLAMAPTAVSAADQVVTVIGDPFSPSAQARVSEDGRLGVRGEVGTYPMIPLREWHSRQTLSRNELFSVLATVDPGEAIAISQITLSAPWGIGSNDLTTGSATGARVAVVPTNDNGGCSPGYRTYHLVVADIFFSREHTRLTTVRDDLQTQLTYPVPLTVQPEDVGRGMCVIAWAETNDVFIQANGLVGELPQQFSPPKTPAG